MISRARSTRVERLEGRRLFSSYYLAAAPNGGLDSNAGTDPQHPWASIAKLNATTLQPGDAVYFEAGDAFAGNIVLGAADAGTASAPVTFDTYSASGTAVTYAAGTATINAGNGTGLLATDAAGLSINDLNFVGSGQAPNSYDGVQFDNNLAGNVQLASVTLNNVTVTGFGKYGITVGGSNGKSGFANVSITDCTASSNIVGGIETHGVFSSSATTYANSGVYLGYDTVFNNPGYAGASNHTGDGIILSDVTGGTIEHCLAYNNGSQNTHVGGPVGIWAWDSNNVTIQSNTSHDNHTNSKADGGGFDLDGGCTHCTMQYNYSYDNDGAGYGLFEFSGARAWNNNTVRFNISENDGRKNGYAGIMLYNGGSGVSNAQVYDNTVYLTPAASGTPRGIYVENGVTNVGIYNNLIQTTGGALLVDVEGKQTSLTFAGNDYYTSGGSFQIKEFAKTYASLSAWQKATGEEMLNGKSTGYTLAPGFAGTPGTQTAAAYQLLASSAMIGTGLNLTAQFGINPGPQDYFGDPTNSTSWNMGAD